MPVQGFESSFPTLGEKVYVAPTATVIGQVTAGNDVSFWPGVVVRGDVNSIRIGNDTNVQDGSILHVSHAGGHNPDGFPLLIGRGVTIGHRAVIHGCDIGDYCLVGIGCIVMDGAVINSEVMLGAGSLVPPGKTLESGFLYLGSPAKKVRPLTPEERSFLSYSARHYMDLKNRYLVDGDTD